MNTEVAVVLTVGGIVGSILVTQMWQMNWFKRENFKMQKTNVMAENRIKMKKLERELGLKSSKTPVEHETPGVLDLLKGLDRDKIAGILEMLQDPDGSVDYDEPPKNDLLALIDKLPPGVVEGFLKKLGGDGEQEEQQGHYLS